MDKRWGGYQIQDQTSDTRRVSGGWGVLHLHNCGSRKPNNPIFWYLQRGSQIIGTRETTFITAGSLRVNQQQPPIRAPNQMDGVWMKKCLLSCITNHNGQLCTSEPLTCIIYPPSSRMIDGVLVHSKRSADIWVYIYIIDMFVLGVSNFTSRIHRDCDFWKICQYQGVNKFSSIISGLVEQLWLNWE